MNLGNKIENICDNNDITQCQMANDLQVSNNTISSWKYGTTLPSAYYVKLICETYKVSADWLLDVGDKKGKGRAR